MRLIDADMLQNKFEGLKEKDSHATGRNAYDLCAMLTEDTPTIDAVPVVHGRWIDGAENFTCGNHNAECSICHCNVSWSGCDEDFNYCPNCGARMDGE